MPSGTPGLIALTGGLSIVIIATSWSRVSLTSSGIAPLLSDRAQRTPNALCARFYQTAHNGHPMPCALPSIRPHTADTQCPVRSPRYILSMLSSSKRRGCEPSGNKTLAKLLDGALDTAPVLRGCLESCA